MTSTASAPHVFRQSYGSADGWCAICHTAHADPRHVLPVADCPICHCRAERPRPGCTCVVPGCVCPDPTLGDPS